MLNATIVRRRQEAQGVVSLELADATGAALPAFEAGAHIDVEVAPGLVRQYSLCNAPGESGRYRIAVLREDGGRGGSQRVHAELHEGMPVRISAPRNHFPLAQGARDSRLFAAGIGITPILAMAQALATAGEPFELHYSARAPEHAAFGQEMASSAWAPAVNLHFSETAAPGAVAGRLDIEATLGAPQDGTHLYVCGPRRFMDAFLATARALGWPDDQVHHEYFAGGEVHSAHNSGFEVELERSGRVIRVAPAQTIVEALTAEGIAVDTSCEQGVCGTCLTRVLAGTPEHRDSYLTDSEKSANDQMLICCSRALCARLVLDL